MDVSELKSRKVPIQRYSTYLGKESAEANYWRSFKYPTIIKLDHAINAIHFSETEPYNFAVASGTKVELYQKRQANVSLYKTVSYFHDIVRTARYRRDGRVFAAGGDDEFIQIFDANSRAQLRKLIGHKAYECVSVQKKNLPYSPVRDIQWRDTNTELLSASNDKTVRLWDMPGRICITNFQGHDDHVRCLAGSTASSDLWFSGSYDHTIKAWDLRTKKCVMTIQTDDPVEDIAMFSSGSMLAGVGGTNLSVYDIISGGKMLNQESNHQKTITCVTFDNTNSRILTGSIDHHLKVYETETYGVVHTMRFASPILTVSMSVRSQPRSPLFLTTQPDSTHLVAGMSDGTMSVRRRVKPEDDITTVLMREKAAARAARGGTVAHRLRGKDKKATSSDFVVHRDPYVRLKKYEKLLNKFQYSEALNSALSTKNPVIIVSLMRELENRNALVSSVEGRDAEGLEPVLQFVIDYIVHPRYAVPLITLAEILLDSYAEVLGQSSEIDNMMQRLSQKLKRELKLQKSMLEMQGILSMLVTSSSARKEEPSNPYDDEDWDAQDFEESESEDSDTGPSGASDKESSD